jgi:hypothetical protein
MRLASIWPRLFDKARRAGGRLYRGRRIKVIGFVYSVNKGLLSRRVKLDDTVGSAELKTRRSNAPPFMRLVI